MSPIESIIYMMWRGFAIGVMISAPMGPVGILCIQRTLDKGRKAGFYTGIGAAISDLFYCLLTGFGLSFIEDFLQDNQNIIQLLGSIVLIAFSIYLFKKNPSSTLRRPVPQNVSAKKNILGGFLFTFSNPLIIFLIIGLFARFNFTAPEIKGGFYAIGYLFIVIGALSWWYGITHLIASVRTKFNMRSMKRMNIGIGIVILAFACVGIVTSIMGLTSAEAKGARFLPAVNLPFKDSDDERLSEYQTFTNSSSSFKDILLFSSDSEAIPEDCDRDSICVFRLDFKLKNLSSHPMKSYPYTDDAGMTKHVKSPSWGIVIKSMSGEETVLKFHPGESDPGGIGSRRALFCEAEFPGVSSESRELYSEAVPTSEANHFRIDRDSQNRLTIRAGHRKLCSPISFRPGISQKPTDMTEQGSVKTICLRQWPGSKVEIGRVALSLEPSPAARRSSFSEEEIAYRLAHSKDPTEGRWRQLDYTLEEDLLKSGGEYEIIILRREDGNYELIYSEGASINRSEWQTGMLKGLLRPTGLEGIYNAEWRDAMGRSIETEIKAQREPDNILTIFFPRQSSTLRFARMT